MRTVIDVFSGATILKVAVVAAIAVFGACGGDDDKPSKGEPGGATETNVAPALCVRDDDCPSGVACKTFDGGAADAGGFCDVDEMTVVPGGGAPVSSAAPAACESDDDCPAGIECVVLDGARVGFCDVTEMIAD